MTTVAGILLILAPEEPSLSLGGGALYSLWIGIVLLVLAGFVLIAGVCGCICVGKDSTVGLCCVRDNRIALYTIGHSCVHLK